jgi:hypothetical protein
MKTIWLTVDESVVTTPTIEAGILKLETYFEKHKVRARVTSGVRGPSDQLRIIRRALVNKKLDAQFPECFNKNIDDKITWNGKQVYAWQPGWSKLLNVGYIVNPPYAAECLLDYYRPGSIENKKGHVIGQTPHINGKCIDVGGGVDGIAQELKPIQDAYNNKVLKSFLPEHGNNAVHCDFF